VAHVLPKAVGNIIYRICFIYKQICAKMVDLKKLENLENDVMETLCLLEKYSPPPIILLYNDTFDYTLGTRATFLWPSRIPMDAPF